MPVKRGFAPVAFDELAWQEDRDGTSLSGCVKVYLPPLGAFGVRHLLAGTRGETVYRLAHRRLNG